MTHTLVIKWHFNAVVGLAEANFVFYILIIMYT